MKRIKYFMLVFVCLSLLNSTAFAQVSTDYKQYNLEKERILNTILNSKPFDSIYSKKRVYFASNELLSVDSDLKLKRKKCKANIWQKALLEKRKIPYVVLGDFTMARQNPIAVRVQIASSQTHLMLNARLEKIKSQWVITNHLIIEE